MEDGDFSVCFMWLSKLNECLFPTGIKGEMILIGELRMILGGYLTLSPSIIADKLI